MPEKPAEYEFTALPSLSAILELLAIEPGHASAMAGGTDLMVALAARQLPRKPLLSLHHLTELRFVALSSDTVTIGAGTTFCDLRLHPIIAREFPLLGQASTWSLTPANQERGTLGGNIVNSSPAADSPPALLVYDAELTLISARGLRTVPYSEFYLGYKTTVLRPDELLQSITMKRHFRRYIPYIRKVGAPNAQSAAQIALAALALMNGNVIDDIRLGTASLRDVPTRLVATEQALIGRRICAETIALARAALLAETRPINEMHSTAAFRSAITVNLLEEFLNALAA